MNNAKKKETIEKRKTKQKEILIEQFKKMPILQIAFEKTGITRATYYRWRNEDADFRKLADDATAEGEAFINDMSESQLISMIRDRDFPAVKLWLQHHHPKYAPKLEIMARPKLPEQLTPEQEIIVKRALRLASIGEIGINEKKRKNPRKRSNAQITSKNNHI